ncbi:MAG: helix-turn-helix transcriptional regulator [Bacteroidota bacterium]|nr:MAG: helix-turn-helix transcriptional regulator [Bacteroidota bacterium]
MVIVHTVLFKPALKQLMGELNITEPLDFNYSLADCLNGNCQPEYLVIEMACLTSPASFTLERLRKKIPRCKIMLICAECMPDNIGAYVDENIALNEDETKINSKLQSFFSKIATSESGDNTLSEREKEVIKLVAIGKTNKEISDTLFISPHTVITHRKNITAKLGIKTIAGLVVYSVLNGLIDPDQVNR